MGGEQCGSRACVPAAEVWRLTQLVFVLHDGPEQIVDARDGESIMQAALSANIDGILAECGGSLMCATCHVYLDLPSHEAIAPPSDEEGDMLDSAAAPCLPSSRLSCQILVHSGLDGLVVRVPPTEL